MEILKVNYFTTKIKADHFPDAIQYPDGKILYKKGINKFPYECPAKNEYKNKEVMIYENNHAWNYLVLI